MTQPQLTGGHKIEFLISQGSVATCQRWDGYCHMRFVAKFIRFPACKNFENRLRFDNVPDNLKAGTVFERQCESNELDVDVCDVCHWYCVDVLQVVQQRRDRHHGSRLTVTVYTVKLSCHNDSSYDKHNRLVQLLTSYTFNSLISPRVGSGTVRIGPLRFLTGGSKSRTKSGFRLFC